MKYLQFITGKKREIWALNRISHIESELFSSELNGQMLNFVTTKFFLEKGQILPWQCSELLYHQFLTWFDGEASNIYTINVN